VSKVATRIDIRPFTDADEDEVIQLLNTSLGGGPAGERPAEFFRWKHRDNPFGRSFMLIAEADGRIVGLRAFMRWGFVAGDSRLRAVRAVDTATHPDHQGRGVFSRLTLEALDALRGEIDFVFNTPNEKSLPGYLKMGWSVAGRVPIRVKVRRPIRFARHARGWRTAAGNADVPRIAGAPAAVPLSADGIGALLEQQEAPDGRLRTPLDEAYLRWRYADAPLLGYRAEEIREGGRVEAISIFRVRPRGKLVEGTVAEAIVRGGNVHAAARTLRRTGTSADVDHLTCSFAAGSTADRAAIRAGFIRAPGGPTLAVNTLGHHLEPDPLEMGSWALSAGDVEVF
jgi:GNAT superfamily N-acetyltransferase